MAVMMVETESKPVNLTPKTKCFNLHCTTTHSLRNKKGKLKESYVIAKQQWDSKRTTSMSSRKIGIRREKVTITLGIFNCLPYTRD